MDNRMDENEVYYLQQDLEGLKGINLKLAAKLCHACQLLEDSGVEKGAELEAWWDEHKKQDAEQRRKEEIAALGRTRAKYLESVRERLLGQLTADEKEAMGIHNV